MDVVSTVRKRLRKEIKLIGILHRIVLVAMQDVLRHMGAPFLLLIEKDGGKNMIKGESWISYLLVKWWRLKWRMGWTNVKWVLPQEYKGKG